MKRTISIMIASVSVCVACAMSCSTAPESKSQSEPENQEVATTTPSSAAAALHLGYIHRTERTSFNPSLVDDIRGMKLLSPKNSKTYFAGKIQRTEGARGVWAIDTESGWSGASPSAEVLDSFHPYGATLEEHNAKVKEYFVAAGLPRDQIGDVAGFTQTMETGETDRWQDHQTRLVGYTSVLRRVIDGVVISDSSAAASLADSGRAVRESVFWPAVPKSIVSEAKALMLQVTGKELAKFRAQLPADVNVAEAGARVVVKHQSEASGSTFAHAVVEMTTTAGALRHFDARGAELHFAVRP